MRRITVTLPDELSAVLENHCTKYYVSASDVLREALSRHLNYRGEEKEVRPRRSMFPPETQKALHNMTRISKTLKDVAVGSNLSGIGEALKNVGINSELSKTILDIQQTQRNMLEAVFPYEAVDFSEDN